MAKVVLELSKKTPAEKKELGEHMESNMNGNPYFTTPNPALADVLTACGDVDDAIERVSDAQEELIAAIDNLDAKDEDLSELLTKLGAYIQNVSGGNKEIIESSGAKTQKVAGSTPAPIKVSNVTVDKGEGPLGVKVNWKGLPKSYHTKLYEVRYKMGSVDAGNWSTPEGGSTTTIGLKFNVPAAGRVWVQVRAKNKVFGEWSDPATFVVESPL